MAGFRMGFRQLQNMKEREKGVKLCNMKENRNKHRLSVADVITLMRIVGTILLVALKPLSAEFFIIYTLTGVTDVLDGMIARMTKTASDFGAKLDSIADLLFYAVMLVGIFPILWAELPRWIWLAVALVLCLRAGAYITAAIKYRRFASLHTYLNKLTGAGVFMIPFSLAVRSATPFCIALSVVAALASLEELIIHLHSRDYAPNEKSLLLKKKK